MTSTASATASSGTPPARNGGARLEYVIVLCPLAAVANSLATGVVLGVASVLLLAFTSLLLPSSQHPHEPAARLTAVLLVVTASVTVMEFLCKAFLFAAYAVNGAFLPLVVASGAILGGALVPASASKPLSVALVEALRHGAEIALPLIIVGGLRQLLGGGFTLALVPAGGFLALALLVAAHAAITAR